MAKPDLLLIGQWYEWDLEPLNAEFNVTAISADTDPASLDADFRAGVRFATLKGHAGLDGAFMDHFPKLELIANYGVGYDAIDVVAAAGRGIAVTNTPDVLSADVADLAVLMLLSYLRQSVGAEAWLRSGQWGRDGDYPLQRKMSGGQGATFTSNLTDGIWTVEMTRKLVSDKAGDVSFDTEGVYNFGFAIHDDFSDSRFHHVSLGYRLGFDKDEEGIEINATKQ